MSAVIEIDNLYKTYGNLPVIQGLDLRVGAGEAFGLLGANGSGKSTLIHLMLGFLRPNKGTIRLLGSPDLERMRLRIGYIPERQRYHTCYSPREYLRLLGQFSGLQGSSLRERVDSELATVGLAEVADRRMATFSKGMLQRLGVAQALLLDPDLLLIDEPTSGLDPAGQREVLKLLAEVRVRGHTVFLCTHYLHEVELLCDRVGVLARGRIATEACVANIQSAVGSVRIVVGSLPLELRRSIEALGPGLRCDTQSVLISGNTPALQAAVLRQLVDNEIMILSLEPIESPLERLYLETVRGELPPPSEAPAVNAVPANAPMPTVSNEPPLPSEAAPSWVAPPVPSEPPSGGGDTLLNQLLRNKQAEEAGEVPKGPGSPL